MKVLTFGEIMLRLKAPGHERFFQSQELCGHRFKMCSGDLPCFSEADPLARTHQKLHPQLFFQIGNRHAHCRLAQIMPLCHLEHRAQLCRLEKILNLFAFHLPDLLSLSSIA